MYNPSGRRDLRNQNYSGQDLRRKNFSGADLRGADFRGANLRNVDFNSAEIQGANFHGANLCEANFTHVSASVDPSLPKVDFSNAKIEGTNFTYALLNQANFTGAQAGLTRSWSFILYGIHIFLCLISAFTTTISITFLVYFFRNSRQKPSFIFSIFIAFSSVITIMIARTLLLNFLRDWVFISVILGIVAIVIVLIVALITATNEEEDLNSFFMTALLLVLILMVITKATIFAIYEDLLPPELGHIVYNLGSQAKNPNNPDITNGAWISAFLASIIGAIFGCWFSRSAITENTQFNWLWKLYIRIATHGGTLFNEADLTDATFTSATLKGANFKKAIITRTRWRGVNSLEHARVGNSYLKYLKVRQLLLGRNVRNKEFNGLNLEGINLEEANLSNSSFIGTNLNRASLRGSNLEHANLQQAKLDGANLSNTCLTGACLEDWTIDETTILNNVICDYIFLEELPDRMAGRRRFPPSPNNFRYGDFEKFFRKDNSILQLLIRSEDNRQALTAAFRQLMHGNHYQLQGFEMMGEDALVKIQVPNHADTSAVENKFYQTYKTELEQVEQDHLQNPGSEEHDNQLSLAEVIFKALEMGANMSGDRVIHVNGDGNYNESISGTYVQRDYIVNMSQDLAQAATQIQTLIEQLQHQGVNIDVAQKEVATQLVTQAQNNPTMKAKLVKWGQSLGDATVSDVVKGAVKLAIRSVGIPLP